MGFRNWTTYNSGAYENFLKHSEGNYGLTMTVPNGSISKAGVTAPLPVR